RYGSLIIFTGRMLPAVRTVISLPAGISRMNLPKFLAYTFLGSVPWNLALTYVGLVLGEHWVVIEKYARVLDYVVIVLAIIAVLAFYIYKTRNRKEYQRS
ncbi:MAG: DedA family protein, partial [Infirmifilum sp.]